MPAYSPERRTAVVLSGTGVHGAYHAGVLRALQEAGVKVDVVAGHGAGAANALVAAIDGQARLWEPDGLWLGTSAAEFYSWTAPIRALVWLLVTLAALVVVPVALVVVTALVVYPLGFLLGTFGVAAGQSIVQSYQATVHWAFAADALPTMIPRLGLTLVVAVWLLIGLVTVRAAWLGRRRRTEGAAWWRVLGTPMDADLVRQAVVGLLAQLLRGAPTAEGASPGSLGRRYVEALADGLGQPGFRELIIAATDLDARRDIVGALLRPAYAPEFLAARPERDRRADLIDLSTAAGRDQVVDLVCAALTPPVAADPQAVAFPTDGHWRGETHRLCDRPGLVHRVLEEVAASGVTQVILVSACAPVPEPHQLRVHRLDLRHRAGEFIVAAEAAALRDALETARLRFDGVYVIRPTHNPLGPFDCGGGYDRFSDRQVAVGELVTRGYDDALQQFVEPVVGASGEKVGQGPPVALALPLQP